MTLPDSILNTILDHLMIMKDDKEEKRVWNLTKDDKFSCASAYKHIAY